MLPALQLSRWDVSSTLRSSTRGTTRAGGRTRSALVLAELALGTVLLVGAGLLIRSFERLTHVDPGFRPDHLVVFDVALSGKQYEHDAGTDAFVDDVTARLSALPGVTSVAATANRPFDPDPGFDASTSFSVDGEPEPAPGNRPESRLLPVSPSYFATVGMTLVRGRTFTEAENRLDAPPVVVINEALARQYFPGEDPIGKHLTFGLTRTVSDVPGDTMVARGEIVGIVRTVRHTSLADQPEPATYFPYRMLPFGPTFVVRTAADPARVEGEIRRVVADVDRTVPIYGLGTMDDALAASVAQPRFYTVLLTAFAGVALLLAALGIYGVISYAVSQRTREFGIRMALGASAQDVAGDVVRRGAALTAAGLGVGVVGAAIATRVLRGLLFGVAPLDAAAFVGACVVLGAVATIAAWLPARRASRADPVLAMRVE
jgi:predicted permease